jgi:hypothetical protein
MNMQHKELAAGRWQQLSFVEQMANIGSEIVRALNWKAKSNPDYCRRAFERALELIDLTLGDWRNHSRYPELTRVREAVVDFFFGENKFQSTETAWKKYFTAFAFAARKNR